MESKGNIIMFDENIKILPPASIEEHGFSSQSKHVNIPSHSKLWTDVDDFLENPQSINAYALFMHIKQTLCHYVAFENAQYPSLLALWIMGTYVHQLFDAYPYLHIQGQHGSGKTKIQTLLAKMCYNPIMAANMTMAALFRIIESTSGTMLIDEAEFLSSENATDYRLMLNAGYKKGASVYRMEMIDKQFDVCEFDVYSPKAISSIAKFPPTLSSRCIHINTQAVDSDQARRTIDLDSRDFQILRNNLYRFAFMNYEPILDNYVNGIGVAGMHGRQRELFAPLKALEALVKKHKS